MIKTYKVSASQNIKLLCQIAVKVSRCLLISGPVLVNTGNKKLGAGTRP